MQSLYIYYVHCRKMRNTNTENFIHRTLIYMIFETNENIYSSYPCFKMCIYTSSVYSQREFRLSGLWIIDSSFYNGKKYWAEIRKQQNHSRDQNEQLTWLRSEGVIRANNHNPTHFGEDIQRNRGRSVAVSPKNTGVQFTQISKDQLLNIYYELGVVQTLDYSNEQNKQDP